MPYCSPIALILAFLEAFPSRCVHSDEGISGASGPVKKGLGVDIVSILLATLYTPTPVESTECGVCRSKSDQTLWQSLGTLRLQDNPNSPLALF